MRCAAQTSEAGFTLIEVLISLFIFALISVGTMTALMQSLQGQDRLRQAVDGINEINSARAIIRSDMNTLTLRTMRDELGGVMPYSLTTDGEALLTFTRAGRENPGGLELRGDLERVEYRFENGTLIRRSLAHENPSSGIEYYERVLLNDLQDVELIAQSVISDRVLEVDQIRLSVATPAAAPNIIGFEITDNFGDLTTHYFEVGS